MRIVCSCPAHLATSTLVANLRTLGLTPTVTDTISVVYVGDDKALGEALVMQFAHQADHSIEVRR